jgi:hypothetical protein
MDFVIEEADAFPIEQTDAADQDGQADGPNAAKALRVYAAAIAKR